MILNRYLVLLFLFIYSSFCLAQYNNKTIDTLTPTVKANYYNNLADQEVTSNPSLIYDYALKALEIIKPTKFALK